MTTPAISLHPMKQQKFSDETIQMTTVQTIQTQLLNILLQVGNISKLCKLHAISLASLQQNTG